MANLTHLLRRRGPISPPLALAGLAATYVLRRSGQHQTARQVLRYTAGPALPLLDLYDQAQSERGQQRGAKSVANALSPGKDGKNASKNSGKKAKPASPGPAERSARRLGRLHTLLGLASFVGPAVTGNQDGLVNVHPGKLAGAVSVNWAHALPHLWFGLRSRRARRSPGRARLHLLGSVAVFGGVAAAAWPRVKDRPADEPTQVGPVTIDRRGVYLQAAFAGLATLALLRSLRR